jgi:two-component sensor histidine kinase
MLAQDRIHALSLFPYVFRDPSQRRSFPTRADKSKAHVPKTATVSGPTWAEADRLAALGSYEVLDTDTEADFDDLANVAARICGVPIALVSLVDDRRQWFKAAIGLDVKETPREVAFCAHAIQQPGLFTVDDATQDARFANNPLVTDHPNLRFYTGAPLITAEGLPLGTLCVLDTKPGHLTDDQRFALETLARQVVVQLELRRTIVEQRKAVQLNALLVQELQHRVKNTFATVQAVVSQSLRNAPTLEAARESATDRLVAMGRAHDIFTAGNWRAAKMIEIIRATISGGGGESSRYRASGPPVELSARAALGVALALHELHTNAIKFGALSNTAGKVDLTWRVPGGDLVIEWRETGGPPVVAPTRKGFGSRMIVSVLSGEFGGESHIDYRPDGVVWTFTTPLARLAPIVT